MDGNSLMQSGSYDMAHSGAWNLQAHGVMDVVVGSGRKLIHCGDYIGVI